MKDIKNQDEQLKILKELLSDKWGLVRYSESVLSYEPELSFNSWADYEIYAREIWLYFVRKRPSKKKFVENLSRNLCRFRKSYDTNRPGLKQKCNHVAKLLWTTIAQFDFSSVTDKNINAIEIELRQKFRSHCCAELSCTDNASRRYFFRSRIVYVREINTYVLTNLRKYIPFGMGAEYKMDQDIYYKILNYCPFCGCCLKHLRLENPDKEKLIRDTILQWRDCGLGLLDNGEVEEHRLSYYGVNVYDSRRFVSETLTDKYAAFDKSFGVNADGTITANFPFITVEKLFDLYEAHRLFDYFDCDIGGVDNYKFPSYCRKKFENRETFSESEKLNLSYFVGEMLIAMYHTPNYFDELIRGQK